MNRLNDAQQKVLKEFEAAIRAHERMESKPIHEAPNIDRRYKLAREHMIYSLIKAS